MIYYPNKNYYTEVKNGVAFVKERRTGRNVGYWEDKKYISYALSKDATINIEGKIIETDEEK